MNDEEVAFRIVRLYFEEIARLGFKRQLDLEQIINAYFYTLKKLGDKESMMEKAIQRMVKEEVANSNNDKSTSKTTTVETNYFGRNNNLDNSNTKKETETVSLLKKDFSKNDDSNKPMSKEKSITDILEER
jgi:hypothetical protein